ncbi:hypothetical protein [Aurantiacibacter rhizosphaerae]|uniref:Uncharacterized protein n=1 Tax=Aurantiacibacter rhizosphaerae TaxID=2691582 RepID=A0A844XFZ2_9SPHN|nr:hypothetical protein [Aurantiacibacter rhizosphaerae]MWV28488.1 hypothetical protein [Aurantiacibacter rhizosphaerae]
MPERQSLHPDNELIDSMQDGATPSQGSRSGGTVNTRVGTRDEIKRATDPENREPTVGSDNPAEDAKKGPKTQAAIQSNRDS